MTTKRQLESGAWKANEIPQSSKSGFLTKRSRGISDLIAQRRFFVLIGSSLYYYKSNQVRVRSLSSSLLCVRPHNSFHCLVHNLQDTKPRGLMSLRNCQLRCYSSRTGVRARVTCRDVS